MNSLIKEIPGHSLVKAIIGLSPIKQLSQSFTFVYKGQSPNVAVFLAKGKITLGDRKIQVKLGEKGRLIAFKELLDGGVACGDIHVEKGAKISIIDRQVAQEIVRFSCLKQGERTKT